MTIFIVLTVFVLRYRPERESPLFGGENERLTARFGTESEWEEEGRGTDAPSAGDFLRAAIKRMEGLTSISAKMDLKISVDGDLVEATGKYEELSSQESDQGQRDRNLCYRGTNLFRVHVAIPRLNTGETSGHREDNLLDIVCDRNSLWTYTSIEGEKRLTEIKLNEMAGILSQSLVDDDEREKIFANEMTLPSPLAGFPGLGGMTGLLRRILICYDFDLPKAVSVKGKNGTIRAWKLTGRMKKDRYEETRKALLEDTGNERERLLDYVPRGLEIYLGQKNPFPYRIRYYSMNDDGKIRAEMMTLEFNDIYENHYSVGPENFVFAPGGITSTDVTRSYLESLIPGIKF